MKHQAIQIDSICWFSIVSFQSSHVHAWTGTADDVISFRSCPGLCSVWPAFLQQLRILIPTCRWMVAPKKNLLLLWIYVKTAINLNKHLKRLLPPMSFCPTSHPLVDPKSITSRIPRFVKPLLQMRMEGLSTGNGSDEKNVGDQQKLVESLGEILIWCIKFGLSPLPGCQSTPGLLYFQ